MRAKKTAAIFLVLVLLCSSACSDMSGNEATSSPGFLPQSSPEQTSRQTSPPELVRALVFEYSTEFSDSDDTGSSSYEYSSRMELYETSPGVFEGEETAFSSSTQISKFDSGKIHSEEYSQGGYRTGHIILELDKKTTVRSFFWAESTLLQYTRASDSDLGADKWNWYRTSHHDDEITLRIEGDAAMLYSGEEGNDPLTSEIFMLPLPEKPFFGDTLAGKAFTFNNTYCEIGKEQNHEYRCVLTAAPANEGYEGNLFIYGDGDGMPFLDESVSFKMQPYDKAAYLSAGGSLPVTFDAMGTISTSKGNFIVLLDGDRPLIERADSEYIFYGHLIPEDEAAEAERVADATKPAARILYDGAGEKYPNQTHLIDLKPPWYLSDYLPKPNHPADWTYTGMSNDAGINIYIAKYLEYDIETYELFLNYRSQLESADAFEAVFDQNSYSGVLRYKIGAYSVSILIRPPLEIPTPSVSITIR